MEAIDYCGAGDNCYLLSLLLSNERVWEASSGSLINTPAQRVYARLISSRKLDWQSLSGLFFIHEDAIRVELSCRLARQRQLRSAIWLHPADCTHLFWYGERHFLSYELGWSGFGMSHAQITSRQQEACSNSQQFANRKAADVAQFPVQYSTSHHLCCVAPSPGTNQVSSEKLPLYLGR